MCLLLFREDKGFFCLKDEVRKSPDTRTRYQTTRLHITSRHITSRHITSHHITSHRIASHHVTSRHVTSRHITSHHATSHHVTSRHITSRHITSHHITSHHITSHHITSLKRQIRSIGNTRSLRQHKEVQVPYACVTTPHRRIGDLEVTRYTLQKSPIDRSEWLASRSERATKTSVPYVTAVTHISTQNLCYCLSSLPVPSVLLCSHRI